MQGEATFFIYQAMELTPKAFASRLALLRYELTHSLPLFRPWAFPSMSRGLIRLQPESLTISGLPIHVARIPVAPFPLAPFSVFATAPRISYTCPATLAIHLFALTHSRRNVQR
jgi:hypothetical protein